MLWLLTLVGLLVRLLRQPTLAGTYDARLDELLYAGQRLLNGELLYADLVNGSLPLAQLLYAPSAWLGSLTAHRVLILLVNLLGGFLLALALGNFGRAGLLSLRRASLVPLTIGGSFVVASQMFPGGLSGHLSHFANTFLVLALFCLSRSRPWLSGAGAALVLAMECFVRLASPLLMVTLLVLVLLRMRRPLAVLLPLLGGGGAAFLLSLLPYAWVHGGGALAWAGAVQLPLELSNRFSPEGDRLVALLGRFLGTNVAGLPIWLLALVPSLGIAALVARQCREPLLRGDQLLLIPGLAMVFVLELLLSFQKGEFETHDMHLLVLPLLLFMGCGFAQLESNHHRWSRGIAVLAMLLTTLIFFNNSFLSSAFHRPRQPKAPVLELEADRAATRRHLSSLPSGSRRFTAPQDVALQRQLGQRASTTGIGPEWSLNQQQISSSWASRTLRLPTDPAAVCRQLTDPLNSHLVWMRTDPNGPNTERFLRSCLDTQPGRWSDISTELGLRTGEYRVFRHNPIQPP